MIYNGFACHICENRYWSHNYSAGARAFIFSISCAMNLIRFWYQSSWSINARLISPTGFYFNVSIFFFFLFIGDQSFCLIIYVASKLQTNCKRFIELFFIFIETVLNGKSPIIPSLYCLMIKRIIATLLLRMRHCMCVSNTYFINFIWMRSFGHVCARFNKTEKERKNFKRKCADIFIVSDRADVSLNFRFLSPNTNKSNKLQSKMLSHWFHTRYKFNIFEMPMLISNAICI